MNASDSFAYVDRSLAERRAVLNPDDPGGTKYMDMVTNAMPGVLRIDAVRVTRADSRADGPRRAPHLR